tara:strand:- start:643 stop:1458 length:816 start_codon:yes stop_codon:yes gene_type:complete
MKIFKNKHNLKKAIEGIKNISFVPTMGGFHKGHISLIEKSKKLKGKSLVSIFINPKQFNEKKDFKNYPRNMKKDLVLLKRLNVDFVYLPTYRDIFSFKVKNKIYLDKFSKKLCGKSRKNHFKGVLNVVNRFLEVIEPKYLLLGIKDFQQLKLIKLHILRRKIKTKVISCETIREKNGVACSTRNKNLTKKQIIQASKVFKYLKIKKNKIQKNLSTYDFLSTKKDLIKIGVTNINYIELLNLKNLKKPKSIKEKFKIFIAYYLGSVRLIDNI